jgi:hypothetical protein
MANIVARRPRFGLSGEVMPGQDLVFQGGEERLRGGIVLCPQLLPIAIVVSGVFG